MVGDKGIWGERVADIGTRFGGAARRTPALPGLLGHMACLRQAHSSCSRRYKQQHWQMRPCRIKAVSASPTNGTYFPRRVRVAN